MWRRVIPFLLLTMTSSTAHAQDWEQTMQAVTWLQAYLRINTTNPPGDVRQAAIFLTGLLRQFGIEHQLFIADESDGKLNILARLKGSGHAKPLLLLNHMDVVPVERDKWQAAPFSGDIRDGFIWGRGALDMKGMGLAELVTLIRLKQERVPLARDVLWLAVCDEEVGGIMGAKWMVERHWNLLDPEFVLDEGGGGSQGLFATDGRIVFAPSVNEKQVVWLKLAVRGEAGHGSMPHGDTAGEVLTSAVNRLLAAKGRLERAGDHPIVTVMRTQLGGLAPNRYTNAITKNTITLTSLQAGIGDPPKVNVIPSEAAATLDCRLLPGVSVPEFLAALTQILDDDRVHLEVLYQPEAEVKTSSDQSLLFRTIEQVVKDAYPDAVVMPQLLSGGTDSRFFRMKGAQALGFEPLILTPKDLDLIHGHNERISIEQFHLMIRLLYEVVKRVATTTDDPKAVHSP